MKSYTTQRQLTDLAQVFRDLPVGSCTFDLDLHFVFVNEWLAAINGVPAAEHIGRKIYQVIPAVAAGVEAQLRQVIDTGEAITGGEIEAETPAMPGEMRVFRHTFTAIKDTEDAIIGVSCLVQEITQQRRVEDALLVREPQSELVMNAVPALIAYIDRNKRFLFTNHAYQEMFGLSAEQLIGIEVRQVLGDAAYKMAEPCLSV